MLLTYRTAEIFIEVKKEKVKQEYFKEFRSSVNHKIKQIILYYRATVSLLTNQSHIFNPKTTLTLVKNSI